MVRSRRRPRFVRHEARDGVVRCPLTAQERDVEHCLACRRFVSIEDRDGMVVTCDLGAGPALAPYPSG